MYDKIFAVNTFNIKLTYNVNNHFKYRHNNIIIASKKIKYTIFLWQKLWQKMTLMDFSDFSDRKNKQSGKYHSLSSNVILSTLQFVI